MPFSGDKTRLASCRELLSISGHDLRSIRRAGRVLLDSPHTGQQDFQALLFDCFFSRVREHPFDRNGGRSFVDLQLYFGSLTPRSDRLVIRTNTAARVARFLLPTAREFTDDSIELAGLPGVRLESMGRRSLLLRHQPTGGQLELLDHSSSLDINDVHLLMDDEDGDTADSESRTWARRLVWREDGLTSGEAAAAHHWATTTCTTLHSALMTRAYLWWWAGFGHESMTVPARRANARYCLCWAQGRTTSEMAQLLTQSAVAIPGAVYTPPTTRRDRGLLRLGDGAIELDGPLSDGA